MRPRVNARFLQNLKLIYPEFDRYTQSLKNVKGIHEVHTKFYSLNKMFIISKKTLE